jgi:hypothetical protein
MSAEDEGEEESRRGCHGADGVMAHPSPRLPRSLASPNLDPLFKSPPSTFTTILRVRGGNHRNRDSVLFVISVYFVYLRSSAVLNRKMQKRSLLGYSRASGRLSPTCSSSSPPIVCRRLYKSTLLSLLLPVGRPAVLASVASVSISSPLRNNYKAENTAIKDLRRTQC